MTGVGNAERLRDCRHIPGGQRAIDVVLQVRRCDIRGQEKRAVLNEGPGTHHLLDAVCDDRVLVCLVEVAEL